MKNILCNKSLYFKELLLFLHTFLSKSSCVSVFCSIFANRFLLDKGTSGPLSYIHIVKSYDRQTDRAGYHPSLLRG